MSTKPKSKSKSTVARKAKVAKALAAITGKPSAFPRNAEPQLATPAKKTPDTDDWIHEIKFDGYRMLCHVNGGKVRFISRNGKDWTGNFSELSREVGELQRQQHAAPRRKLAANNKFTALPNSCAGACAT